MGTFFEKALEIVNKLTLPIHLIAFALVFVAFVYWVSLRSRKQQVPRVFYGVLGAIVFLGLAPLIASTFLESRGVYRIRVVVLGLDKQPVSDAEVSCSIGCDVKKSTGSWELDIPPQTRPANHTVSVFASVEPAFLAGLTNVELARDYYLTATIQLERLPSVTVRGTVLDEHSRAVSGATVQIVGYPDVVKSEATGSFEIPAHAANREMVTIIANKGNQSVQLVVPAGDVITLMLRKR